MLGPCPRITIVKHVIDTGAAKEDVDTGKVETLESGQQEPEIGTNTMQARPQDHAPKGPHADFGGVLNDIDYQNAGKGKIKISAVLDAEGLDMLEKKIAAFRMLIN